MTKEEKNKLDDLLINFHSDDTLYDGELYDKEKQEIFDFVETLISSVELPVKPKIAETVDDWYYINNVLQTKERIIARHIDREDADLIIKSMRIIENLRKHFSV